MVSWANSTEDVESRLVGLRHHRDTPTGHRREWRV